MRGGVSYAMTSTCVQGGLRSLGGYQPNVMMEPSSPAAAWQYHSVIPKREPIDLEERNDSGINSGSDCVSSSPGSDRSENFNTPFSPSTSSTIEAAVVPAACYSSPVISGNQPSYGLQQSITVHMYNNEHKLLTTPNCEPVVSAEIDKVCETTINTREDIMTPCTFPVKENKSLLNSNDNDGPLRRLQLSLEKGGFLPQAALSPKLSECSIEDENKSDNDMDECDEQGLRIPKVNSHGKVKTFKCKQCDFVAITKLDFWEHTKSHIKADKLLTCPKCPFVTEYKHHLEYHLRNHVGSKPFKCSQCSYSCVNKSMLNSHLKSHSNVYQYRCSDCSYATKYCHSLKLHLRKYSHKPAMVLNPDGTPNPLPIIDVYGTRRGPKVKNQEHKSTEDNLPMPEQVLPFPLNQFMLNGPPQLPFGGFPFFTGFPGAIANPLLLHNLEKLARERLVSEPEESSSEPIENESGVLDLSKPYESSLKNRRSNHTFKLDHSNDNSSGEEEEDEEASTTMFSNVEVIEDKISENQVNNNKDNYSCQYCKINFGDPVLYTMHMGYHGYKNPFTCNMCGEECKDKVSFFLHIARTPHS